MKDFDLSIAFREIQEVDNLRDQEKYREILYCFMPLKEVLKVSPIAKSYKRKGEWWSKYSPEDPEKIVLPYLKKMSRRRFDEILRHFKVKT